MSTAQKLRESTQTSKRQTSRTRNSDQENIKSNSFFKAAFDTSLSPEQKQQQIAELLTATEDYAQNRAKLEEFSQFKEFLQTQREEMSKEIIKLTDTDTFSNLQSVYEKLNGGILDFNNKIEPLTNIIEALHKLREDGMTMSIFEEIKTDEEEIARLQSEIDKTNYEIYDLQESIRNKERENKRLSGEKTFFGLGGTPKGNVAQIENNNKDVLDLKSQIESLEDKVGELNSKKSEIRTKNEEYAYEKEKLAELLNLTGEEHKARQQELVDAAYEFVVNSKEEIGTIRNSLKNMDGQLNNLFNMNNSMSDIYALMLQSVSDAEQGNKGLRDKLNATPEDESVVEKGLRQRKLMEVNTHVEALNREAEDVSITYSDLTKQVMNIRTMRDSNAQQISGVNSLYSRGVAGVADHLSSVLTAVSQAAINESQANASNALAEMINSTDGVLHKESIRVAMGVKDGANKFVEAMDSLAEYGEIHSEASKITSEGLADIRQYMDELKGITEETKENLVSDMNDAADVISGTGSVKSSKKPADVTSPFNV